MKFNLSISSFLTLTLTLVATLAPLHQFNSSFDTAIAGKKPTAQSAQPSSNMIPPNSKGNDINRATEAMFRDGDYVRAKQYVDSARKTQPNEPLVYAMSTIYSFSAGNLEQVKVLGEQTTQAAKKLMATNPVRGNLYQGVGGAIGAAYEMKKNGPLGALNRLQQVFKYMDEAKRLSPNDPELNLIKGYMDLLLAVNVPFADTNQAIEQLQKSEPKYLAYRGIYIGYRDLKEYDKAMAAINTAIRLAPNNPELKYYKAQILAIRGRESKAPAGDAELRESIKLFDVAYQRHDKLLTSTVIQVLSERCQAKNALNRTDNSNCGSDEAKIRRDNPNVIVGPTKVPPLS